MIFDKEREQFELNANLIKNEAAINIRDILEDCANGRKTINLSVFSDDQLMDCLNASETLDSFLRNELSLKLKQSRPQADWYPEEYESIPVDVSYDDAVLRIFVPLTLKRINSKRNRIGVFVKHKMFAYEKENGITFSEAIPHPLSILVIRHVRKVRREHITKHRPEAAHAGNKHRHRKARNLHRNHRHDDNDQCCKRSS